jgi:hypothetical protein
MLEIKISNIWTYKNETTRGCRKHIMMSFIIYTNAACQCDYMEGYQIGRTYSMQRRN